MKFQSEAIQLAFDRDVFIIDAQVTPLYTCLKLSDMQAHELDEFCPSNIAAQARRYLDNNSMYLHNVSVESNSVWFMINKDGESVFESYSTVRDEFNSDFKLLKSHIQEMHVMTTQRELSYVPQIDYHFHVA